MTGVILLACTAIIAVVFFKVFRFRERKSARSFFSKEEFRSAAFRYGLRVEVAGIFYADKEEVIEALKVGDVLLLMRERYNKHDRNAVAVEAKGQRIGYLSRKTAEDVSVWIDQGERVAAYVASIGGGPSRGKDVYRVWIYILSVDQLPEWIKAHEKELALRREKRNVARVQAKADGWEVKPRNAS